MSTFSGGYIYVKYHQITFLLVSTRLLCYLFLARTVINLADGMVAIVVCSALTLTLTLIRRRQIIFGRDAIMRTNKACSFNINQCIKVRQSRLYRVND
jgi:hypothetical protein